MGNEPGWTPRPHPDRDQYFVVAFHGEELAIRDDALRRADGETPAVHLVDSSLPSRLSGARHLTALVPGAPTPYPLRKIGPGHFEVVGLETLPDPGSGTVRIGAFRPHHVVQGGRTGERRTHADP